mgnify:CR=1 FL=1
MNDEKKTSKPASKVARPGRGPSNLAKPRSSSQSSRNLLVRASSTADDPVRDGVQLGVIAFTSAAALVGLLVIGTIAERVGIDHWLGAGALIRPIGETFIIGAELPIVMLDSLYRSGVDEPLFFAAALALAIPPIAGLVAARPRRRGAERPAPAVAAASGLTAALVVGADILIGLRASSRTTSTLQDAIGNPDWADSLRDAAATDGVAMILAILLAVLVFRLPNERWVRGLCGTIAIATAVTTVGLAAASAGVVTVIHRDLPVMVIDTPEANQILLVGTRTDGRTVGLGTGGPETGMMIIDPESLQTLSIVDLRSIASIIDSTTP